MANEPLEDVYKQMREKTRALPAIDDDRGPLVYDLTDVPSLNGVDPNYKDLPGVCDQEGNTGSGNSKE